MSELKDIESDKWKKNAPGLKPGFKTDSEICARIDAAWSDAWDAALENNHLIVGALDTLGVALSEHGHVWTDGERTLFEQAISVAKQEPIPRE